jgi:hypothetical protein
MATGQQQQERCMPILCINLTLRILDVAGAMGMTPAARMQLSRDIRDAMLLHSDRPVTLVSPESVRSVALSSPGSAPRWRSSAWAADMMASGGVRWL